MCMAEAGFPIIGVEDDPDRDGVKWSWSENDDSSALWAASYRAGCLVGFSRLETWCEAHYVSWKLANPTVFYPDLPEACPCHGGSDV